MNQVLFICSGNYYRSRFAEILFNHLAHQRGLEWSADSRGFRLSPNNVGPISCHTVHACRERGLAYDQQRGPTVLEEADLKIAKKIIALKESEHRQMARAKFPQWEHAIEYWEIHDIDAAEPAIALVELSTAVEKLINELTATTFGI